MSRRPPRIRGFDYVGVYRHFLTAATNQRQRAFADAAFAREAQDQLLQSAARQRFAVSAFCFMPDHVHFLLTGTDDNCALLPVINRWRQITGFIWASPARDASLATGLLGPDPA